MSPTHPIESFASAGTDGTKSDRPQIAAYLVIAFLAFVIGLMVGGMAKDRGGSRIDWPKQEAPHPRALGS